eukprot:TRINITY_DN2533_c0_g1_i2.p2 TRINITY_DN2533_c0_g1~~TRINITY_DN2533_c0_g1_i2.p2  ORF type:complete len:108 (-),score=28.29 TRINITY_DN2533_c0_g1_i2:70-393(-)
MLVGSIAETCWSLARRPECRYASVQLIAVAEYIDKTPLPAFSPPEIRGINAFPQQRLGMCLGSPPTSVDAPNSCKATAVVASDDGGLELSEEFVESVEPPYINLVFQ